MKISLEVNDVRTLARRLLAPRMGEAQNLPTKGGVVPRYWRRDGDFDVRLEECPEGRVRLVVTDDHGGEPYADVTGRSVIECLALAEESIS